MRPNSSVLPPDSRRRWQRWFAVWVLALITTGLVPAAATANESGTISGTVIKPVGVDTGWIGRITVTARSMPSGAESTSAPVASNGSFNIAGLSTSQRYLIVVQDPQRQTVDSWLGPTGTVDTASDAEVVSPTRSGVTIAPRLSGSFQGTLTLPDELFLTYPQATPALQVLTTTDKTRGWLTLDSDGEFERSGYIAGEDYYIKLDSREFRESWLGPNGTFTDKANRVAITPRSGLNLIVDRSRLLPTIRGKVHFPAGAARTDGVRVVVKEPDGHSWTFAEKRSVQSDGTFVIPVEHDGPHHLRIEDHRYAIAPGLVGADGKADVALESEAGTFSAASPVNIYTTAAVTISGKVELAPGATMNGVFIRARTRGAYVPTDDYFHLAVADDGTFTVAGLNRLGKYSLDVSSDYEFLGTVRQDGEVSPWRSEGHAFSAPQSNVKIVLRSFQPLGGQIEFPEGFTHSPDTPPTVTAQAEDPTWGWEREANVPVAANGSFTTAPLHPVKSYRIRVDYPDQPPVYWTSDVTVPSTDESKAGVTGPRGDVVIPARDSILSLTAPLVSGTAVFDSTLRADGGTWTVPAPTITYQWLRSGKSITGATAVTYKVTTEDIGSRLSVKVTASAARFAPGSATSPETAVVPALRSAMSAKIVKKGTSRKTVKLKLRVRSGTVSNPVGTFRVTYGKKTRTVALKTKHRGVRTVSVPRTKARGTVTVRFTPSGSTANQLTAATAKVKVTKVSPKVTVKVAKKASTAKRVKVTVRVKAPHLTSKPTGKVKITYGKKTRTVTLKAKHKGKVTVSLPRLSQGSYKIRARYAPAKKWRPYVKAKNSKKSTLRVR